MYYVSDIFNIVKLQKLQDAYGKHCSTSVCTEQDIHMLGKYLGECYSHLATYVFRCLRCK